MYLASQAGDAGPLRVSLEVAAKRARHSRLPAVTGVRIDRKNGEITASFTNPYRHRLSIYDADPNAVFFDTRGRVIGGVQVCFTNFPAGPEVLKPGGRGDVSCSIPGALIGKRIASARMTIATRGR